MAEPYGSGSPRSLRSDAERNRARIIEAAWRVFTEHGLDAPMEIVARAAGVGVATVYRRFGSRAELITSTFEHTVTAYHRLVDDALAEPDPWSGFCDFVDRLCAMQADDHGFANVLTMSFPVHERIEAERARAYDGMVELIARAKRSGRLRDDFSPQDIGMLLMANGGVIAATADAAPGAWQRLVAYMIQAFDVHNVPQTLPPPPTSREMYRALVRAQRAADRRRAAESGRGTARRRSRQSVRSSQGDPSGEWPVSGAHSGHGRGSGSGTQRPPTTA